ncbi:MAG: hypothetical protein RLZZ69_3944 [Cyanobacteriota bacterium]
MPYFIEISTYHRFVSSTQTLEDIEKQLQSLEIWGRPARNLYQSNIPKVKAFIGKLPENKKGIEFTTDVTPDPNTPPNWATWSGNRRGVKTEDGYAKLKVLTIDVLLS